MANQENSNKANSSSKFMSYFYKAVQPVTLSVENMRQRLFNSFRMYFIVVVLGYFFLFSPLFKTVFAGNISEDTIVSIFVGSVFYFLILGVLPFTFLKSIYSNRAKRTILPIILKYWGNFSYQPSYSFAFSVYTMITSKKDWKWLWGEFAKENKKSDISINNYVLGKLLHFDDVSYDDKIIGTFKDTNIEFCELSTSYTTRDSKGNSSKHTTFDGIVFSAKLNKKFKGITALSYERLDKYRLAYAEHTESKKHFDDVVLEDPAFTKRFKMASTDQIEARYIFTTAFMERFMKVAQKYNYSVKAIFLDDNVYILIDTRDKNWFEFSLSKPCTNFTSYQEFLTDFTGLLSIVDTLKLSDDAVL